MFDVGFSEMLLIAIVALVVIGPERLPNVARTMGHLFGRLQRYVNDVKADIHREMEMEELSKVKAEFEQATQSVESAVRSEVASAESAINSIAAELPPLAEASPQEQSGDPAPVMGGAVQAGAAQGELFGGDAAPLHPDSPSAVSEPAAPAGPKTAG